MPAEFSACLLNSDEQVNKWDESSFGVCTRFCLPDPGFDLQLECTHFFNHYGEGRPYHYDTTDTVKYLGYFASAQFLYWIDQPKETHSFWRE
jgi:hypothetical protein